ncbi:periplasmic heavy metal sensor [Acidiphilium sp. C61]|uniref:periplasmic heavy metal sensor n=1 Tax=Acidiphilium sp. C61 TaxID=1671485 RepID=UPI001F1CB595|nr:periplasmic heavy metal sensor [Acidiphilium sp. C61]
MTTSRLQIGLVASLLLNALMIGAFGGGLAVLSHRGGWHRPPHRHPGPIQTAGHALKPADRARFRAAMLAVIRNNRDLIRDARLRRQQAGALFVRPDFDRAAIASLLARARRDRAVLLAKLDNTALRFAATLPQGERRKLASGLAEHGELQRRGGRFAPPPQGSISAPPPHGGNFAPPPQGGNFAPPPQGGNSAPPPQGGNFIPPKGQKSVPPQG